MLLGDNTTAHKKSCAVYLRFLSSRNQAFLRKVDGQARDTFDPEVRFWMCRAMEYHPPTYAEGARSPIIAIFDLCNLLPSP